MLWKLAALNVRKHLKRTMLIAFAVLVSVLVMLVIESMMGGMRRSFFENLYGRSGHVQLHADGYPDRVDPLSLRYTIDRPEELLVEIAARAHVRQAEKVLPFGGLVMTDGESVPIVGMGVETEPTFFEDVRDGMVAGGMPRDPEEIAISDDMSELLGLDVGDPAIVLVEDAQGSPFYRQFPVRGIYDTGGGAFDRRHVFISHGAAEDLLYLSGRTIEIRVKLDAPERAETWVRSFRPIAEKHGVMMQTWRELHGGFAAALRFFDLFVVVIDLLVVIVAAAVMTNAILMNVFERAGEYGTLRAIGMKRHQQLTVILAEGAVEGTVGALSGAAVGVPLLWLLRRHGIPLGGLGVGLGLDPVLRLSITAGMVARSMLAGSLIAVVGSLYAAWISGRRRIVDMLEETR